MFRKGYSIMPETTIIWIVFQFCLRSDALSDLHIPITVSLSVAVLASVIFGRRQAAKVLEGT